MTLMDEHNTAAGQVHYCPSCGEPAGNGRYCASCGTAIPLRTGGADAGATAEYPRAPTPARSGSSRVVLIAAGALGLVAVAVAAIILLTSSSGSSNSSSTSGSTDSIYRAKLTSALVPLAAANHALSSALQSVDGSKATLRAAQNAASQASSSVAAARGAVVVLNVPGSDATLSQQVQQALAAENGYVQDVTSTLSNPTGQGAAQLATLATGAQSALVPIASLAPGIDSSVSGTDNLANWAQGAAGTAAAAHGHQQANSSGGGSSSSSSGGTSVATSGSTDCGSGIYAGPNTSCAFAQNVHDAWLAAPGATNTLQVYSPVTHQTYTMNCAPAGSGITCSGGNNASVSW